MESLITKRQINIFAGVALLLLVPLIATLLSDEVNWKLFDFIIAVVLGILFKKGIDIKSIFFDDPTKPETFCCC